MIAIIHLVSGEVVTIENLTKVRVNPKGGAGASEIPPEKVSAMNLSANVPCTFVGSASTAVFSENTIRFVEFKND